MEENKYQGKLQSVMRYNQTQKRLTLSLQKQLSDYVL